MHPPHTLQRRGRGALGVPGREIQVQRQVPAPARAPDVLEVLQCGQGGIRVPVQQVAQRQFGATPTYLMLDEKGPDHSKCFKMAAQIGARRYPAAWGPSKKDAEQRAAMNALSLLAGDPIPFEAD